MHIHVLGVCGTFMGGVAAIATEAGHRVTGCDENVYPPMSDQLAGLGIEVTPGYGAEQLQVRPDVFVVGNVVTRGNPLMEAILDDGAPYTSGPQWLSEQVLRGRHVLAVAGTHGKTTTTAMLAWILEAAGQAPGFLIGGVPLDFDVSARLGRGRPFVIEADEYDTALFDKRSKFVHYRPRTAVLNNLEFDHADIFPDLAAIETQFHHLVRTIPGNGRIIVNARDEALQRVLKRGCWSEVQRFGARREEPGGLRARGEPHDFDVLRGSLKVGRVEWDLTGEHNQLNALAAIAAAEHLGVSARDAARSLGAFTGVRRRLELRGEVRGVRVYDDFAHHPSAIRATIGGLRRRIERMAPGEPRERILAVFEPRSNTMKRGEMKAQLPWALEEADLTFCLQGQYGWSAADALAPLGASATVADTVEELVKRIVQVSRPGDHVLCMSNGAFGGIHGKLLAGLEPRPMTATPSHLLYLHGFRSSPQSFKAQRLQAWLRRHRPDVHWWCPQLDESPSRAIALVEEVLSTWPQGRFAVIGSSLGGFYATCIAERHRCTAVVVNPAVNPRQDLAAYVGDLTGFHDSSRHFRFEDGYLDELSALDPGALTGRDRYLAVIAKGDELLDWREMSARYAGCAQLLIEGSDHALSDFEDHLPRICAFVGLAPSA